MVRADELGSELGALGTVVAATYTINRLLRLAPIQARSPCLNTKWCSPVCLAAGV